MHLSPVHSQGCIRFLTTLTTSPPNPNPNHNPKLTNPKLNLTLNPNPIPKLNVSLGGQVVTKQKHPICIGKVGAPVRKEPSLLS